MRLIGSPLKLFPEQMFPVVAQFRDGIADVIQCLVLATLRQARQYPRCPAPRQFLQAADIEISVMKVLFQGGHPARQETSILTNTVATQRTSAGCYPNFQEFQHLLLGSRLAHGTRLDARNEARTPMRTLVPFIHQSQYFRGLMYGDDRPLGENIQLAVRDDGGHLDDVVDVRTQAGHLEVHPHQGIRQLTHRQSSFSVAPDGSKG